MYNSSCSHPIHRDIAQAVHITCGSHANVENYNKSLKINHYRVTSSTNTLVSTSISPPPSLVIPTAGQHIFIKWPPTINYIYPQSGPNDGNTVVHIHGKYFKNDKNIQCIFVRDFRIMIVKPLVLDEEHITCKTPAVNLVCNYVNYSSTKLVYLIAAQKRLLLRKINLLM